MKKLLASVVCFGLATLFAVAGGTDKAAKIEGAWTVTGGYSKGKKVPDEFLAKVTITAVFKDGKYTVSIKSADKSQEIESGTYKVDLKAKPATIDLVIEKGNDMGKTQLGILKLEGDTLTLAVGNAASKERPKTFEPAEDAEITHAKRK